MNPTSTGATAGFVSAVSRWDREGFPREQVEVGIDSAADYFGPFMNRFSSPLRSDRHFGDAFDRRPETEPFAHDIISREHQRLGVDSPCHRHRTP